MKKLTCRGLELLIVTVLILVWPGTAKAKFRLGKVLRGPIGIHADTQSGVGVTLPTPAISAGNNNVSITATPTGVQTNYSNANGVSAGASSDGGYYGAFRQDLPGNVTTSTGVSNGEVNSGVEVYVP